MSGFLGSGVSDSGGSPPSASTSTVVITVTAGESIPVGSPVGMENSSGSPRGFLGDSDAAGTRHFVIGVASTAGVTDGSMDVVISGEMAISDSIFDILPAVTDVGKPVFLSTNAGKLALASPISAGSYVQRIGFVTRGASGLVKISICLGDSFIN